MCVCTRIVMRLSIVTTKNWSLLDALNNIGCIGEGDPIFDGLIKTTFHMAITTIKMENLHLAISRNILGAVGI